MITRACRLLNRVFRSLAVNPGTFAGGSAVSDPLGLLAVERERVAAKQAQREGTAPTRPPSQAMEES
jgi:hypothetical protein